MATKIITIELEVNELLLGDNELLAEFNKPNTYCDGFELKGVTLGISPTVRKLISLIVMGLEACQDDELGLEGHGTLEFMSRMYCANIDPELYANWADTVLFGELLASLTDDLQMSLSL